MSKFKSIIEKFLRFAKKIKPCLKQQKLYPLGANYDDNNKLEPYFSAIEDAIEQKFINVGLVGDYSSGKSTIIENYLKNSKNKHKAIYLSLAKIGDLKINNKDGDETWKKTIQEKILELLFFQAKVTVPNGSFKKVFSFSERFNWLFSALLAIVSTFFIFQDNPSNHWFLKEISDDKKSIFAILAVFIIAVSFLLSTCYYYLMQFLTFLTNIDYGKFKLKIAEVEAETELTKMPFHKHLREIIYIVQQLTAKKSALVIVEDLDRFDSLDIFTEIREIAILLNRSLEKNKLVFLYALRSQIFVDQSNKPTDNQPNTTKQTPDLGKKNHVVDIGKFFDVIIPVVKSYNNHNLPYIIVNQIAEVNQIESEKRVNLLEVTKILCKNEIVDFRIANNICNHFNIIYRIYQAKSGKDTKYCPAEILALTIYRIFDPIDYDNLHNNCGILYEHFNTSDNAYRARVIENTKETIEEDCHNWIKRYGADHPYFEETLKELTNKRSLLEQINLRFCIKDHSDSNKFIISINQNNNTRQWTVDLINYSEDNTLENEFQQGLKGFHILTKMGKKTQNGYGIIADNSLKIVPIFREIYKEIKKLKQQDQINKIPPISLSKVSQQLIVENYINKDYKKYL